MVIRPQSLHCCFMGGAALAVSMRLLVAVPATADRFPVDLGNLGGSGVEFEGADRVGPVAGTGDVNGDGLDDVIVGEPFSDSNGRTRSGTACVVAAATSPTVWTWAPSVTPAFKSMAPRPTTTPACRWQGRGTSTATGTTTCSSAHTARTTTAVTCPARPTSSTAQTNQPTSTSPASATPGSASTARATTTTLKAAALPGSAIVAAATVLRLVAPALRLVDDRDRGPGRA